MRKAGNIVLTSGGPLDIWVLTMLRQWAALAALVSPDPAAAKGTALSAGADPAARITFLRSRLMPAAIVTSARPQKLQPGAAEIAVSAGGN